MQPVSEQARNTEGTTPPEVSASRLPPISLDVDHPPPERRGKPGSLGELVLVALPLVISTSFWTVNWFFDRMFLTWYGQDEMAACMPAGMMHWAIAAFPSGLASFVNTFVAQYYGAGRRERIGQAIWQGVYFALLAAPLLLLAIPAAPWLFAGSAATTRIEQLEVSYFQYLAPGAAALVLANALSAFYTGRGLTLVVMGVNLAGTLVNIVLDYALVFGIGGMPEMGIAGAGLATTIAQFFSAAVFACLLWRSPARAEYGLNSGARFDRELFLRLLRYGGPSGLPMLIEGFSFALLTRFVAAQGAIAGAATSLAFNVNAVAFVPVIGMSIAVSTLVGQRLGENRDDLAARTTWLALAIGLAYNSVFAVLYWFTPGLFLLAHESFANPDEFAAVRAQTLIMLRFVAAYCLFDSVQVTLVGALKGAGDTLFILLATTIVSVASIGIGLWLEPLFANTENSAGVWVWWWVMTAWIVALGTIYLLRFLQGSWRTMRVTEPEAP